MTADSEMPDKYYWDAGNAHAHMALSGAYVEWLESRLARIEALEQRLAAWEDWDKNHGWAARAMLREYSMLAANRHALAAMPTATDAARGKP